MRDGGRAAGRRNRASGRDGHGTISAIDRPGSSAPLTKQGGPEETSWMKRVLLVLCFVAASAAPAAAQQSVADFYKGKTIRIVVGISVGSGYDVTARALQRHWGKHIPGNPTVIVQN